MTIKTEDNDGSRHTEDLLRMLTAAAGQAAVLRKPTVMFKLRAQNGW